MTKFGGACGKVAPLVWVFIYVPIRMIVLVRKVIKGVHTVMDEFKEQKKALAVESALKLDRASFPTHCVFTRESLAKSSDTVMVLCFYGELKNGRSPPSSDLEPVWLPVSREYAAAAVRSVDLNHPADPTQVSTDTDPSWNENRSFVLNRGSSTVYVCLYLHPSCPYIHSLIRYTRL